MQHKLGAIPTPPDVRDYTIQTPRAAYPDAWEIPIPQHYDQQASTCVICGVGNRFIFSTPITNTLR